MNWKFKTAASKSSIDSLSKELKINEVLSRLLVQRGIDTFDKAKHFFTPKLEDLHDPFLMKDMDLAVERLLKAVEVQEKVMVFGDYDVDGTTAVALMTSFLESLGIEVLSYIPDRYAEGYGVSYKGIDKAQEEGISLIIALDCGIKSLDHVSYAKERDVEFIICDHHRPGDELPKALAILDPKRRDCSYPFKELCGCGVGFKLAQAMTQKLELSFDHLRSYLDLCAISIGSDLVSVTGENRILAFYGLKELNNREEVRPGLKIIMEQANRPYFTLTDVIFVIGPRINAAGRMKHGLFAVELLLETDLMQAEKRAADINDFNSERRETDQEISELALQQIKENKEEECPATVVYDQSWHKGVIGIVASRLIETYYRPTLVFTKSGDKLAASARSIKGFDVYKALEQCTDHLLQFGGHKYAAGLTLKLEQYESFKKRFIEVVDQMGKSLDKTPELSIDSELSFDQIDDKFYRILNRMEPFGPDNEKPVFCSKDLIDTGYVKAIGKDSKHLKFQAKDPVANKTFEAIGFGLAPKISCFEENTNLALAYQLDKNYFRGSESMQLLVKDIKGADSIEN